MLEAERQLKLLEIEAKDEIQEEEGSVVLAQEDRFRIQTDDGRSILFILGATAGGSLQDLDSWATAGRRVHVRFRSRADYAPVAEEVHPM